MKITLQAVNNNSKINFTKPYFKALDLKIKDMVSLKYSITQDLLLPIGDLKKLAKDVNNKNYTIKRKTGYPTCNGNTFSRKKSY
jgi:hypothetical protein